VRLLNIDRLAHFPGPVGLRRILTAAIVMTACVQSSHASAQGLFDVLFGRPPPPPATLPDLHRPPGARITVFPSRPDSGAPGTTLAPRAAFCVRTCDGRFFPVATTGDAESACRGICPAAETKVYYGRSIDEAQSFAGRLYSGLPNAFRYRQELVEGCTCNGSTPLGMAKIDIENDLTLRAGDIVANASGLMVVTEPRSSARRGPRFRPLSAANARYYGIPSAARR
jgi:hypothetical protein